MTARDWSMRRYEPGDEADLLGLFNRVFGLQRSLEHWRWQFERNPYLPPTIIVARRDRDGLLGGSHVLMPVAVNVDGKRVLAGHTLDLVVHEEFRRQRMFETTAKECFVWARERGMRLVFAFPNDQSYPGFVRSLGWSRVTELTRWESRVGVGGALGGSPLARALTLVPDQVLRRWHSARPPQGVDVGRVATAPADHDRLWSAIAPGARLSLWKDREYLAWRYDSNPDHRFEYLTIRRGGELAALAVLWRQQGRVTVCELMARDGDDALGACVRGLVGEAVRAGTDRLVVLAHDPGGRLAPALRGFHARPAPANVFVAAGLFEDELDARVRDARNWTLTFGDADYV